MGSYDVAQICLKGHVITNYAASSPELRKKFCTDCGQPTIMECTNCKAQINGDYHVKGVISFGGNYNAPGFCYNCGNPYPWTEQKLAAVKEIIEIMDELDLDEKQKVKNNITDIISDGPRTAVAATIIKKYLDKATPICREGFKQAIFDVTIEAAKRIIWPV